VWPIVINTDVTGEVIYEFINAVINYSARSAAGSKGFAIVLHPRSTVKQLLDYHIDTQQWKDDSLCPTFMMIFIDLVLHTPPS